MNVKVSINFYNSIKTWYKKRNKEFNYDIFKNKILNRLYFENILNIHESHNFEIIDNIKIQGVLIEKIKLIILFTSKLNDKDKLSGRNTYIAQNCTSAYINLKDKYNFLITVNPFDNKFYKTNSILDDLKKFKTLDFFIGKKIIENINYLHKYKNVNEFLYEKNNTKSKNTNNNGTYIFIRNNRLEIYAKLDGANSMRTYLEILTIQKLNNIYKIFIIPIECSNNINKKILKLLENNNEINIYKDVAVNDNIWDINDENDEIMIRNQQKFTKNIVEKYLNSEIIVSACFACNYNITENLISAHIDRITDIKNKYKEKYISKEEAIQLAISGDNGFFLCPNHDKEFEKGMLIFDLDDKCFKANKNSKYYNEIIKTIDPNKKFNKNHINDNFIKNVKEHLKRINNNFKSM